MLDSLHGSGKFDQEISGRNASQRTLEISGLRAAARRGGGAVWLLDRSVCDDIQSLAVS